MAILILGPMGCEVDVFMNAIENSMVESDGSYEFIRGTIDGNEVIVCKCMIGMVNVAVATALAIKKYALNAVILQGTAGAHHSGVESGDIVLGKRLVELGTHITKHRQEGFGSDSRNWIYSGMMIKDHGVITKTNYLSCDENLLKIAKSVKYESGNVIEGTIACGDFWNKEVDVINYFRANYGTDCEEMEGFAAACVCKQFDIPFLDIRIISNNEITESSFNPRLGITCQEFTLNVVKAIIEENLK